jgi:FkbM family methyltransferase
MKIKKLVLNFYLLIPGLKWIFVFLRNLNVVPSRYTRFLRFRGDFSMEIFGRTFRMNNFGDEIETEIFWHGLFGGWEQESLKVWAKLCRESKVIFDIGANTGIYALVAKAANPNSEVFAFEPVARVYDKLKLNVMLNEGAIHCEPVALSNSDGTAKIYDPGSAHVYSVTVNKNLNPSGTNVTETEIKTVRLDSFVKNKNIQVIDLMKIDVETHEPEVLEGMSGYLNQFKPIMLIEVLQTSIGQRLEKMLPNSDWKYFYIDEQKGPKPVTQLTGGNMYNYLIVPLAKSFDPGDVMAQN